MTRQRWKTRLSADAERDFIDIISWTAERFGPRQAQSYRDLMLEALGELAEGPEPLRSKARDEIAPGLRTLHVARRGRRGRHVLIYRTGPGGVIEIVRILHDSMELARHLPGPPGQV